MFPNWCDRVRGKGFGVLVDVGVPSALDDVDDWFLLLGSPIPVSTQLRASSGARVVGVKQQKQPRQ